MPLLARQCLWKEGLAEDPRDLAKLESTLKSLLAKEERLTDAYKKRENEINQSSGDDPQALLMALLDDQDVNLGLIQTVINTIEKEMSLATVKHEPPVTEIRTKVHAPAIKLLTFDGTTADFAPFWDNFESQIGRHKDIPEVDKLAYLKGQLKGEALGQITPRGCIPHMGFTHPYGDPGRGEEPRTGQWHV